MAFPTAETKPSTIVGISDLHVARQITPGTRTTAPTYDTPIPVLGTVNLTFNLNGSIETFFADNTAFELAALQSTTDVSWEKAGLDQALQAYVLGRFVDSQGGVIRSSQQNPPVLAVLGELLHANGNRQRFCIYEVKFPEGESAGQTKADGVEFQTMTLEGQATETVYRQVIENPYTDEMEETGFKIRTMTEGDAIFVQTAFNNWYNAVTFPPVTP